MSLRDRNRRAAMRHTQRVALTAFQTHGFDNVTVDEIATEVGMAPSTVFRHFGTKERIVLWDEHDAELDRDLGKRLLKQAPLAALRDAFVDVLANRYDDDLEFQLQRVRYIYATEALHAAAVEADFAARAELTRGLTRLLPKKDRHAAPLLAGAALLALDVAMDQWQQAKAKKPLAHFVSKSFDALARLDELR